MENLIILLRQGKREVAKLYEEKSSSVARQLVQVVTRKCPNVTINHMQFKVSENCISSISVLPSNFLITETTLFPSKDEFIDRALL